MQKSRNVYINLRSMLRGLLCKLSPHHLLLKSLDMLQTLQFKSGAHWRLKIRRTRRIEQATKWVAGQCANGTRHPQPRLHAKDVVLVQHARQLKCMQPATSTLTTTFTLTSAYHTIPSHTTWVVDQVNIVNCWRLNLSLSNISNDAGHGIQ